MNQEAKSADSIRHVSAFRANAALLGMALIWALNFPISKGALASVPPLAFNALRFPLAAAVVTLAMMQRGGLRLPERRDRLKLVLLGVLANVVYQLLFIFGLANTRAGTASVILAGTPIATAMVSAGIGQERISARVWLGVVATVGGIALVVAGGRHDVAAGENALLGDLLLVAATLAWAVYSVATRDLIQRYGALPVTTWTLWTGATAILIIGLPSALRIEPGQLGVSEWFAVVYAGALSIGVAYVLWSFGVRQIGPTRTATYSNLVPVFALLAAWLMLGERPSPIQVLGASVIIVGVMSAQMRGRAAVTGISGRAGV